MLVFFFKYMVANHFNPEVMTDISYILIHILQDEMQAKQMKGRQTLQNPFMGDMSLQKQKSIKQNSVLFVEWFSIVSPSVSVERVRIALQYKAGVRKIAHGIIVVAIAVIMVAFGTKRSGKFHMSCSDILWP